MRRWLLALGLAGCGAAGEATPTVAPPMPVAAEVRPAAEVGPHSPPAGLEARMLAAAADSLEVFSLDPSDIGWLEQPAVADPAKFRNVRVLGSTKVQDAATRQAIVREVFHNFHPDEKDLLPFGMGPAYCFEPRHGLRVVDAAGPIDAVICYECGRMHVHAPEPWEGHILYFGYGRALIRETLTAAGVPLPPGPE